VIFPAAGGQVNGPKIFGLVRPVGADWLTVRSDGVGIRDACATFETDDRHAPIYRLFGNDGPRRAGLSALSRRAGRQRVVKRTQCLRIGAADLSTLTVGYDVYSVS
jgi:hypothetical protein